MSFALRSFVATAGDRTGEVYELAASDGTVRAEVWPQWGFNCLKWQVRPTNDQWADIFFHMPDWTSQPIPTRSGHPILFPFPGRLRHGRLTFAGREYQLPLTDATKQHAIHGFTPRNRWRVIATQTSPEFAAITGEFHLAHDLPEAREQWPADFVLRVTYRLRKHSLRVEASVQNVGANRLPCGLGYHGYFRIPGMPVSDIQGCFVQAHVHKMWHSEQQLPTGDCPGVTPELDFRQA
ncbi:MAG: aldose 1-epimerase, partial [Gemmata sp.]|nr:aldose 1-epimerase [Gemmata sp.]